MRFSPVLLDEIRARLPVSQVVSKHVRLKKAGREYIGLSPFKQEKTPSFTVNDDKGFYHCFASGEHGDIFSFLIKVEGLAFPEAVEKLAAEAGVELPKESPREAEQQDRLQRLREVVEASCRYFEQALQAPLGREALGYLRRRGLDDETIRRFRLGYAPAGRDQLKRHLLELGFKPDEIITSGMCIGGRDIAVPYDRFRDRVMFPIEDLKSKVIAFGGRALSSEQKAKYLNSPETPLFHKGKLLYNIANARQEAFNRDMVIAVEGYMDVIACARGGYMNTVAPLGTALTEDQIRLMWRLAKEPVLCFDGDEAGRKAAFRAVDTALPLLVPGYSLRFAFLPEGQDPDDLLRDKGAAALTEVLNAARPLVDVLWQRQLDEAPVDTPERRAAFEARLNSEIERIDNQFVKTHYEKDVRQRLWELWRSNGRDKAKAPRRFDSNGRFAAGRQDFDRFQADRQQVRARLSRSPLIAPDKAVGSVREALMLQAVLTHPWLLEDTAEELAGVVFSSTQLGKLRDALLQAQIGFCGENGLDSAELRVHLKETGFAEVLDRLSSASFITERWVRRGDVPHETVEQNWRHLLGLYRRERDLQSELYGAERAFYEEGSEENFVRVKDLNSHYQNSECTLPSPGDVSDEQPLDEFAAMVLEQNGLLPQKQ